MKQTNLQIVQMILNKMNGDEVNSVGDTTESMQILLELMASYYAMIGDIEWPGQFNYIPLEPSLDTDKPTHMRCPDNVDHFKSLRYNNGTAAAPNYIEVCYLDREAFVDKIISNLNGNSTAVVQDYSGAYLTIVTNKHPTYYTLFDDEHVVFDSYASDVDDTLQASKVIAYAQCIPSFELTDDFVPDLHAKDFPQLIAETTAACFSYWKQQASPTDERRARRLFVRRFNNQTRTSAAQNEPLDFGR